MSNSLNQNPAIINASMAAPQNLAPGLSFIRLIWVWGAATDTFTLKDGNGNTLLVGIGTTTQTTGMWVSPFTIPCVNGYQVTSITASGTGALYVFNGT